MTASLSQVLDGEFPQSNYKELGQGHWLKWHKSYLSHTREGWKIVHLNLFQRMARHLFTLYESTHLKNVVGYLCKEQDPLNGDLLHRMINAWKKAYPQETCPLLNFNCIAPEHPVSSKIPSAPPHFQHKIDYEDGPKLNLEGNHYLSLPPIHYQGIPGEWYIMKTSQIKHKAPNACTSIALFSLNSLLSNPDSFTPDSFNNWIKAGSQKHLDQYGADPLNRYPDEVIKDLDLNRLHTLAELTFSPNLAGVLEGGPQTPEDLTTKMIEAGKGNPFAASLSDGRETIALYYKNNKEIYILDSHQKSFQPINQPMVHLDMAYVVKCKNKEELDSFLFSYRYFFEGGEEAQVDALNEANQIDVTIFQ